MNTRGSGLKKAVELARRRIQVQRLRSLIDKAEQSVHNTGSDGTLRMGNADQKSEQSSGLRGDGNL